MTEQLFGIAIGTDRPREVLSVRLDHAVKALGFSEPPRRFDRGMEYLRFYVGSRSDGGTWLLLEEQPKSPISLVRKLVQKLGFAVDLIEVSAVEKPVRNEGGELGYPVDVRRFRLQPDGTLDASKSAFVEDADLLSQAHGDFYETVSFILTQLAEETAPTVGGGFDRVDYARKKATEKMTRRIEGLLADLETASRVAVETIEGSTFLRLTLPNSGSRLARVTDSELLVLREAAKEKFE